MSKNALIGHTGFVGSNLLKQFAFDSLYRSNNIEEIRGREFDLVVCAGIQAKKWWANQNADEDLQAIQTLLDNLETISAKQFVLISTVDVYPTPSGVDEDTPISPGVNHAYGENRLLAEEFIRSRFESHLVLRLPGLFGDGIKKNVIHDLLHRHELEKINPLGVYQYYSLDRLAADIERATDLGLSLLNISAEPISTREILQNFFPDEVLGAESQFQATYDMKSKHWSAWGSSAPGYLYDKAAVFAQLGDFITRQRQSGHCATNA